MVIELLIYHHNWNNIREKNKLILYMINEQIDFNFHNNFLFFLTIDYKRVFTLISHSNVTNNISSLQNGQYNVEMVWWIIWKRFSIISLCHITHISNEGKLMFSMNPRDAFWKSYILCYTYFSSTSIGRKGAETPPSCPSTPGKILLQPGQARAPMFITVCVLTVLVMSLNNKKIFLLRNQANVNNGLSL